MEAENLGLMARVLGVVARFETILAPSAFAELAALLGENVGFVQLAITRSERPGFFRVLASTRGALDAVLPFRTLLSAARHVHEAVYLQKRPYVAASLERGMDIERVGAKAGFGSYAILPIYERPEGEVIAGLVVAFKEVDGVERLAIDQWTQIAAALGPSVARGLTASQKERALRILEASGDALIAWDAEGRVTDVNPAAEQLVGARKGDLLGVAIQELFGAVPIGPSSGQRLSLQARDGRRLVVSVTVSPVDGDPLVYAHALIRDLSDVIATEQDAAERLLQLRELTEQHMVLLDNAPLLIFRLDPESHEILYLNRHAEHLFGVPAAKALSTPGFLRDAHVDPDGAIAFEEAVVVAKLGQAMPAYEARLRREGDEPIVARGTIYPIVAESGRVVGIEGILLDVTSERVVRSKLLQADRLATVGMLSAGVAHEINNPAAFMLLGLDVLSRTLSGPLVSMPAEVAEQVRQLVADLKDTGRRIVEIARDMRTFASPPSSTSGRRTLVDVSRTIESALTITRAQIVERADFDLDLAADLPLVSMDDGRLGQVVVNLLVNAAQAIAEARAQRGSMPAGDRVRVATRHDGDSVEIVVQDTGIGIKPELIERVFVPFFTTKLSGAGMGLGLAISRSIVEAAGGTIVVESPVPGLSAGSRFIIRLPVFAPELELAPPADDAIRPTRSRSLLLIEDEPLLGRALADQLSEVHDVTLVGSGEEALDLLARRSFDAILCDVLMSSMGGVELYRALRKDRRELCGRFVFMTGVGFAPELDVLVGEDGVPVLEKPFPIETALSVIEERLSALESLPPPSLENRHGVRETPPKGAQ